MNIKNTLSKIAMVSFGTTLSLGIVNINSAQAGLIVNTTNNANTLTSTILGPGITLVGTPTYVGAGVAAGTFSGGISAGIGIDQGIILTSGSATNAIGPNDSNSKTTDNGLPGDTSLNALISGNTLDATSLSFQFTSTGGDLFFNYVFASEEYNEFVGTQFNDVFGFFLDGQNIALIPSTTTPVAINTVNLGSNSAYYKNNSPGPYDIQYDGFTTVLTAKKLGLSAGTHTIKLAVADTADRLLDSGVFIQANTFSDTPQPVAVPEPDPLTMLGAATAIGVGSIFKRKLAKKNKK